MMQVTSLHIEGEGQGGRRILSAFSVGRTVGILLLFQLAAALTLPFILAAPITVGSPAFLTAAREHSTQIRSGVLLSFIGSGLTIYLGIAAFEVFRLYKRSLALLFVTVCAVSCVLDVVHAGTVMSMLSLSSQFVSSGAADMESYQVVAASMASARRSAHSTQLLAIAAWMFVFYYSLFRVKLIPRVLSVIGIIGVGLQFTGVTLMMLLGYPVIGEMAMPLLPIQIVVSIWLIVKGFNDPIQKDSIIASTG